MSLLITPTLLNSYDWYTNCPESWKDKAYNDLKNTLGRIWSEPNEAVKKGMDFEKQVYKHANKNLDQLKASNQFKLVCSLVRGGDYQAKSKKIIKVDDIDFCLYGKLDVKFTDKIQDIKTTSNYRGEKKYLSTWQHIFYCFNEMIKKFEYIVVEFTSTYSIRDVHIINFECDDFNLLENQIKAHIKKFGDFLAENKELETLYYEKFNMF